MKKKQQVQVLAAWVITGVAVGIVETAEASGFALVEQSVKQVGSAISGGAASAEDASTIYFNPAGMTRLSGTQVSVGMHIIMPSAQFKGGATTIPAFGGTSISGGDGGDAGSTAPLPSFYYTQELNERLWFGLGIGALFGLSSEYDSSWVGRYHAIKSELMTVNINPSLAYKVNDQLSLGFGINAMHASAELSNAVDYSAACLGSPLAANCAALGLSTPANATTDGEVSIAGDNWGYGFDLGLIYELSQDSRVGVAYRSKVKQELQGTVKFTGPAGITLPPAMAAAMSDGDVSAAVDLPASLSASLTTRIAHQWDLMADVTWTQWSNFDELRIVRDGRATVQPENWDDTYKISLGFNYRHDARWTWRGGIAYDQTPIPNAESRTPRIPGNNRKWIAAGLTYAVTPAVTTDFALAHLFVSDPSIDATDSAYQYNLSGTYELDVNLLSAQINWQF